MNPPNFKPNQQRKFGAYSLCLSLLLFGSSASAAILLADNFDVISGNSQNVNQDLAVRQSGPLALATYTGIQTHHQVGNTGTDVGQPGGAANSGYVLLAFDGDFQSDLNIAAVSAGTLTIDVDMYNNGVNPGGGGDSQWVACSLRAAGDSFPVAGAGEFGFRKRANGGVQVFQDGINIAPGAWDVPGFATADHWTLIFTDTAGTGSAFTGNGSQVTLVNGTTTNGPITLSQLNSSGLKLGFTQDNNRFAGIDNLTISGTLSATPFVGKDPVPNYAETFAGDSILFTADFNNPNNVEPVSLQWEVVQEGVTNEISGASGTTLMLNNVQTSDSGFYRLRGENSAGITYTASAQLVVSNVAAAVNNAVIRYSSQNFPNTFANDAYLPNWTVDTNNLNLIYGFTSGSGEGTFAQVGDFTGGGNYANGDATVLSDGIIGSITSLPNLSFVAGGTQISGAGQTVTYTLVTSAAPNGFAITNITVFGGWPDAGRDEQKYQIQYSTMSSPGSFVPLTTVQYNPSNPQTQPSLTRTVVTPETGTLAQNVAAIRINFNLSPGPENGWEGYSELLIGGMPSTGFVPNLVDAVSPQRASDVEGSQLIITANFANYTSLQWEKDGTNVVGATSSTLTLDNLQISDSGAYKLVASNASGSFSSSACLVTVNPAPAATSNIVTSIATQTSEADVFTPTWSTAALASSLISAVAPSSSGDGDFTGGTFGVIPTGGSGPEILTDGTFGTVDFNVTGLHVWTTCMGSGSFHNVVPPVFGGQFVTYTLPSTANGYTITNIMTAGGWNDGGRDQQSYTIKYSTVANPAYFIPLTTVSYNPTNPIGYSMNRVTITPASGVLASNVAVLLFDMTTPAGENGFSGYSEFAVHGSPSTTPATTAGPVITVENQKGATSWTVETPNLIAGQLPDSHGEGVFTLEGCNVTNLTDGAIGFGFAFGASCGAEGDSVPYVIFNSDAGWDLSGIVVYSLWNDYGRDGQFYNVSYSTWWDPTTFLPLASVEFNPPVDHQGMDTGNRVAITPQIGQSLLASNVAAVKFDFTPQGSQDFGWSGYSEIVLQGSALSLPSAPDISSVSVSGNNLILAGTGGSPVNSSYTVLTTTNLAAPVIWTTNSTGTLDGTGAFSTSIPINASTPARFFKVQIP